MRLRLRLARWRKLGFLLLAVGAVLQVRSLARSWDEDWVRADLRLGRFEEAVGWLDEEVDPELAALARRAALAPEGARHPASLKRNALAAWNRGDRDGAREWLQLARLQGAEELDPLIDALQGEGKGIESLPTPWREALRSATGR